MNYDSYEAAGIVVDIHNTGEQKTLCPECSDTRKKSKDKCLC